MDTGGLTASAHCCLWAWPPGGPRGIYPQWNRFWDARPWLTAQARGERPEGTQAWRGPQPRACR